MIHRCDKFFTAFEELRAGIFGKIDRGVEESNLKTATVKIETNPSADNYLERALSFYKLGENKNASRDIKKMLELNNNYVPAYLLRGLTFDRNGKYEKAISDFQKCKSITQKVEFDFFIAISERKQKKK